MIASLFAIFCLTYGGTAFADTTRIALGVGSLGGSWYSMGTSLSKIWGENVKGVSVSVATGGSRTNLQKLGQRKIGLGLVLNPDLADGVAGKGDWAPHQAAYKTLRTVYAWPGSAMNIVVLESSGIKKISDLKGKRICPGAAGTGIAVIAQRVMAEFGVTKENAKFSHYSGRDAADQLKDGHIDAAVWSSFPPYAIISDVAMFRKIRLLGFEDDQAKNQRIAAMIGAQPYKIPSDAYGKNQVNDEPIRTLKYGNSLVVPEDFDEDIVYRLVKAVFENLPALKKASSAAKRITVEGVPANLTLPLHKGAERYLREVGVIK